MFDIFRLPKRGRRSAGGTAKQRQQGRDAFDRRLLCEALEARTMLSGGPTLPVGWQATPHFTILGPRSSSPAGLTPNNSGSAVTLLPNQVRSAYGLGSFANGAISNGISFAGIQGDGRGQTIAIVDAYDDPNAASDLNYFSTYYGLPTFGGAGHPTFEKLNENGGTSLPAAQTPGGWGVEESLDIEWAHVMAPMANIILFEASTAGSDLYTAEATAAGMTGVVVVSNSWSGDEFSGETSDDSYFTTPSGHLGGTSPFGGANLAGGVAFMVAAGDSGAYDPGGTTYAPQYPDTSPNVVSVGGTTLLVNGNGTTTPYSYGSETVWGDGTSSGATYGEEGGGGGGGGGISAYESQPSYQSGVVNAFSTTKRTYPDVSADADPESGVPVYDTYDFGPSNAWQGIGGTSLATPLWAGMIAVTDEGRAIAGQGSLYCFNSGLSAAANAALPEVQPALYKMPAANIHDITSGNNGYAAGVGYDLASGRGTPVGNLLLPELAGPSIVMGAAAEPLALSTDFSVLGADSAGESNLTYTWAATTLPSGATAPTFSVNGSNAAMNTTAVLNHSGTYVLTVTITDTAGDGMSVTSSVSVTLVSAQIVGDVYDVTTQPFTATALDSSGNLDTSPPSSPLSVDGNAIDLTGATVSVAAVSFSKSGETLGQEGSEGTVVFNGVTGPATVTVAAGSAASMIIPVELESDLTLSPAAGGQLTISGGISGPGGINVDGQGAVFLAGTNSYTGDTTISAGTLIASSAAAIAANTGLTVDAGGIFIFDPSLSATSTVSTSTAATSSVVAAATSSTIATSADTAATSNTPSADTTASASVSTAAPGSPLTRSVSEVATPTRSVSEEAKPTRSVSEETTSAGVASRGTTWGPRWRIELPSVAATGGTTSPVAVPLSAAERGGGSSVARSSAADLSWLQQSANSLESSNQQYNKEAALQALDAAFAQYGQ